MVCLRRLLEAGVFNRKEYRDGESRALLQDEALGAAALREQWRGSDADDPIPDLFELMDGDILNGHWNHEAPAPADAGAYHGVVFDTLAEMAKAPNEGRVDEAFVRRVTKIREEAFWSVRKPRHAKWLRDCRY